MMMSKLLRVVESIDTVQNEIGLQTAFDELYIDIVELLRYYTSISVQDSSLVEETTSQSHSGISIGSDASTAERT
jgi:hypothetical protein